MRITFGRGNNRKSTVIATGPTVDRVTREQQTFDLKQLLFNLGILRSLS